ncbi:hypothetical protein FLM52_05305 [bacterium Scap17]|nr:hypothetical protein [bacterium Scap17]
MKNITRNLVVSGEKGDVLRLGRELNRIIEAEDLAVHEAVERYQHLGLTRELALQACNKARRDQKQLEARQALRKVFSTSAITERAFPASSLME